MRPLLLITLFTLPAAAADEPWLIARLGNDRFRQEHAVTALTYSPDGKLLASADGDSVIIWDASSGRRVKVIPIEQHDIFGLRFGPDGRTLYAAANDDRSTRLCKIDHGSGKLLANLPLRAGKSNGKFSDDGNWLALRPMPITDRKLGRPFDHFQVVHTATGRDWTAKLDGAEATAFAFHCGKSVIAVGGKGGHVRIFDLHSGRASQTLSVDDAQIGELAFSLDGNDIAAHGYQSELKTIFFFAAETGRIHWSREFYVASRIRFSADNKSVLFYGSNRVSRQAWHQIAVKDGALVNQPFYSEQDFIAVERASYSGFAETWHPIQDQLAVGSDDGLIAQWDFARRKRCDCSATPAGSVNDLCLAGNGKIVTGWANGRIDWQIDSGNVLRSAVRYDVSPSEPFSVSPNQKWLARFPPDSVAGSRKSLNIHDFKANSIRTINVKNPIQGFHFLPNSTLAIQSIHDIVVVDPERGLEKFRIETDSGSFPFLPRRRDQVLITFYGAEQNAHLNIWDLNTGKSICSNWPAESLRSLLTESPFYTAVRSPDCKYLAFQHRYMSSPNVVEEKTIVLDSATGRKLASWNTHPSFAVAFTLDSRSVLLYTTLQPFSYCLYEIASGEFRGQYLFGRRPVSDFSFTPDARQLLVATRPYPVEIWDPLHDAHAWDAKRVDEYWKLLADPKADKAYAVIRALLKNPPEAAAFLKVRVQVPQSLSADWLADRLKALDAAGFKDREKATVELTAAGELAYPRLRAALPTALPEVRRRIESILAMADAMTPEKLRAIRVCEIAEVLGTAQGKALLEEWTKGAGSTTLVREAKASLERVRAREK